MGAGIGYLVARKINNANYDFFVEQAKAKAKAIEFEAEGILRNSKISVQEAEFEAKKKYEDKASKLQKEFNVKFDELGKGARASNRARDFKRQQKRARKRQKKRRNSFTKRAQI